MKQITIHLIISLLLVNLAAAQNRRVINKIAEKRLDENSAPNTGPTPDYSKLEFWAASPYKWDTSDSIPESLKNEIRDLRADVFFIHPTSFFGDAKIAAWNADLTDREVNQETDFRSILFQASAFNGSCRVFAPRYRQANMKAFYVRETPLAQKAFDVAYSDLKKAFQWYMKNENMGRPVIIASHSQGSLHAKRLLQEFFDGKSLSKNLVCAYIIGYRIEKNAFKFLPVSGRPNQTGCFVGWRSYAKGEIPKAISMENGNSICVNPITWTTTFNSTSPQLHKGIMLDFKAILPGTVSCMIEPVSKILWIETELKFDAKVDKMKNLHTFDINLFWMDIRENAKIRIETWYREKADVK